MAEDFKRIQPTEYLRRFVSKGVRPDGRSQDETRSIFLNVGSITTSNGSALVKIGNTTVICGIKAEFTMPRGEMSNEGYIVPNFELSPVSSPNVHPGPPSEQEQVISQFLSDLVNRSSFVNLQDLCIEVDKLAWVLYCDLVCLDSDGSLTDASVVAFLSALASMRLPGSWVNEDTGLGEVTDTEDVRLHLNSLPVATTFGLFDGVHSLADPNYEEETLCGAVLIVTATEDGSLFGCNKSGGSPLPTQDLPSYIAIAVERAKTVKTLIETVCKDTDKSTKTKLEP